MNNFRIQIINSAKKKLNTIDEDINKYETYIKTLKEIKIDLEKAINENNTKRIYTLLNLFK